MNSSALERARGHAMARAITPGLAADAGGASTAGTAADTAGGLAASAEPTAHRRRIAVLARDPVGTGGGAVALETARGFAAAGHEVRLIVDAAWPEPPAGVEIELMPFGPWLHRWQPRGRIGFRLRHLAQILAFSVHGARRIAALRREGWVTIDHNIEAWGGDLVVLHNVFLAQYRADHRPLLRRLPQFLNPTFTLRLLRERLALRSARVRGVVAVSASTEAEAAPLVPAGKPLQVIASGVDLGRFRPLADDERERARAEDGVAGRFVLLFVGHEFERKRLDLVVEALARLPEPVCAWVVGGRMSSPEPYRAMAQRLGVDASRLRFFGTRADTEHFFQRADAFVLPSDYETWGLVTLEAMACGVPAVMTPVGCAPSVIRDGESGYVVPPQAEAIAERVGRLLASPALHRRLRDGARTAAEAHGWAATARRYLAFIEQVSPAPGPHSRA